MTRTPRIRSRRTPPTGVSTAPGQRGSALPPDLLREAARRLGILALVTVGLAVIDLALGYTLFPRLQVAWPPWLSLVVASIALLSLGVFLYTRRGRSRPQSFITLGLAYEVVVCASLGFVNHLLAPPETLTAGPILSRISFLLLIFPAFVPSTPRATLVTAVIGASMDPLAMATVGAARHLSVPAGHLLWMHITNYFSAGIAVVISHIITRLGREVRDARDLGSYRLGALLGRGGMGEVYVAHHRMLARPAAIKLIRPEVLRSRSPDHARVAVERFRREAEAAANLRSPHTIELYDFGVSDDGVFYYVMELLDGADLEGLVERFGPLPPERVIHLLRQACDSLAEAHARGLIHRDIKPSNIHACRMGLVVDFVKLLDFGLVKPSPGRDSEAPTLTAQGAATPGTPAFMAPEAVFGDPAPDHRADIYALGCVGYWLLTGGFVFAGPTAAKMLVQHLETPPERPSRRTQVDVPPELDAIILDCLAKRADDRPAGASELARRLAACPVREPWTDERAHEWWNRHLPAGDHIGQHQRPDVHRDFVVRSSAAPESHSPGALEV